MSDPALGSLVASELVREFRGLRRQAERALEQIDDRAFFAARGAESNSIAVLVKHIGGNLRSRWTDALTSDGEKPDRDRDNEFVILPGETRDDLMRRWHAGWSALERTLEHLTVEDLTRTIAIRHEPHSVVRAALRSMTHTAGHVGQIVMAAKEGAGDGWRTLSIPRGQSQAFNQAMETRHGSDRS